MCGRPSPVGEEDFEKREKKQSESNSATICRNIERSRDNSRKTAVSAGLNLDRWVSHELFSS